MIVGMPADRDLMLWHRSEGHRHHTIPNLFLLRLHGFRPRSGVLFAPRPPPGSLQPRGRRELVSLRPGSPRLCARRSGAGRRSCRTHRGWFEESGEVDRWPGPLFPSSPMVTETPPGLGYFGRRPPPGTKGCQSGDSVVTSPAGKCGNQCRPWARNSHNRNK